MIEPIEMNVDFSTQDTEMNVEADMNCKVEIPLPIASATTLGGIKVGENLSITEDGTLSADANADDVDQLKNALTAVEIVDTASGAIASFADGSDGLPVKGLKVQMEPIQAGSGDPSPTNIRPISGRTAVTVTRTGFNVWDEEWEVGNINATTGQNEADSVIRSKNYIPVLPNTVYYANVGTGSVSNFVWFEYDADKNYLGQQKVVNDGHGVFTTSANAHYIRFRLTSGYGTTYNHDISINYPSTDHDYHAYQGQSIEIQLGQTIYGGTLDVTQGVLTVNYKKIAIPKTGWQFFEVASGKGVFLNTANIPSDAVHTAIPFCNALLGVSSAGSNTEAYEKGNNTFCFRSPTYDRIYIRADQFGTDTSAFETFLSNCEMCYKYTNPQTIQLTTQQITTLLGQNNVWSDADSVSVDYVADTKLYIAKVISDALS